MAQVVYGVVLGMGVALVWFTLVQVSIVCVCVRVCMRACEVDFLLFRRCSLSPTFLRSTSGKSVCVWLLSISLTHWSQPTQEDL